MTDTARRALVLALWGGVMAPAGAEGARTSRDAGAGFAPAVLEATGDCRISCGLVLGVTSFTVATGTVVTWGRVTGGIQTASQGRAIWAISFGASLATAATLSGSRREQAVYSAGVGAAAGALVGFTLDAVAGSGEGSTKVAAALIGATLGAVAGGVYGAFSDDEDEGAGAALAAQRIPLVSLRIPF